MLLLLLTLDNLTLATKQEELDDLIANYAICWTLCVRRYTKCLVKCAGRSTDPEPIKKDVVCKRMKVSCIDECDDEFNFHNWLY